VGAGHGYNFLTEIPKDGQSKADPTTLSIRDQIGGSLTIQISALKPFSSNV
jgi:hypothetical protein